MGFQFLARRNLFDVAGIQLSLRGDVLLARVAINCMRHRYRRTAAPFSYRFRQRSICRPAHRDHGGNRKSADAGNTFDRTKYASGSRVTTIFSVAPCSARRLEGFRGGVQIAEP